MMRGFVWQWVWMLALMSGATAIFQQTTVCQTAGNDSPVLADIHSVEQRLGQLPDRAPALSQLAHDYAALGDMRRAMALVKEYVSLREDYTPEGDSAFDSMKESAEFRKLVEDVHREFPAVHHARTAFVVPQPDLVPEGLAVDVQAQIFYMSSMNRDKIVKISRTRQVSDFVPAEKYRLQSVCGIKVDRGNRDVWANTCPANGSGAELVHFDRRGNLLGRFHVSTPGPHLFNDLVLTQHGEIFLTDSLANLVYLFDRGKQKFTALSLPRTLYYPNGIALSGDEDLVYVSDAFGILRYDLRSRAASEVSRDIPATIAGFDGLYWYKNTFVGIQNSLGLPRVVQFSLSTDGSHVIGMKVLEYRTQFVQGPTTGAIDGSKFYFMSNTQIDNWANGKVVEREKLAPVQVSIIELESRPSSPSSLLKRL
jgi:sugar lactone lactonase YvrE